MQEFLDKEVQLGVMWGPFDSLPLGECHVSPLMSRPKDGDSRRIIVDLSYGDKLSVNGCTERGIYDGAAYSLTLPSLDYLIADIMNMKNPCLIKVDIARAFRNIPIDPGDALKLCLSHNDKFYVDRSLAFGAVHGTAIFQRVSDAIRRIMQSKGIHIWNYIDDFFACVEADSAVMAFEQLKSLVVDLGLPINETKVVPPAIVMTCMGIQVDAGNKSLKIPDGKIDDILDIISHVGGCKYISKQKLQSLLGKLLYISKIVVPAGAFLNRMLQVLRDNKNKRWICLNREFHRDLNWFGAFLPTFNDAVTFQMIEGNQMFDLYVDASLQGLGACWGNVGYSCPIPEEIKKRGNIVRYEMYNVVVALAMWGMKWGGRVVRIYSDNMAVLHVLNNLRANDEFMATCLRNVLMLLARHNIHMQAVHISGILNKKADALSRLMMDYNAYEWVLTQVEVHEVPAYAFQLDSEI